MKTSNKIILMVAVYTIAVATLITTVSYVSGATLNTITVENNRREYTYCPISDTIAKTNIEIDGCPLVRVYVNDWNRLTVLQQNTIDTQLRSAGFVDAGEHVIR